MNRADWAPSPDDVGSILHARTTDKLGNELGTFTQDTRPTGDQVSDLIDTAVADIYGECGPIPDDIQDNARRVAAIGSACLVELGYFPNEINSGRSPYLQLKTLYDDKFTRLKVQVAELNSGGSLNNDDVDPVFGFDYSCDPDVFTGWLSQW